MAQNIEVMITEHDINELNLNKDEIINNLSEKQQKAQRDPRSFVFV